MKNFTLFLYNPETGKSYTNNDSNSLKSLKEYVDKSRDEGDLLCELYITDCTRVVKRYKEVV